MSDGALFLRNLIDAVKSGQAEPAATVEYFEFDGRRGEWVLARKSK